MEIIEYDMTDKHIGSGSATGYIMNQTLLQNKPFSARETTLAIYNYSKIFENNNLLQVRAFIDDLLYLKELGVTIAFK